MFVQSHIQRHNHNHHHHHHSHTHHQPQQQQHHLHGHNHRASFDAASVASRKSTSSNVAGGAAEVASDQSKTTTARLAYSSPGTSEQKHLALATQVKSSAAATAVNNNSNNYQDHDHRVEAEHENWQIKHHSSRSKTRERNECGGSRGDIRGPVTIRPGDSNSELVNSYADEPNRTQNRRGRSDETELSLSLLNIEHRDLACGRDRTRSLGSHRSLKVCDFMPRNKQAAATESATATTCSRKSSLTTGSYCGDHFSSQFSTTLRLAQTVSVDEARVVSDFTGAGREKLSPRRAFSDSGCSANTKGGALRRYIRAGSQQLLALILNTQTWFLLAGRLSSSLLQLRRVKSSSSATISSGGGGSSSGNRSKSVELVRNFCLSFISYQVETWRLLANDLAAENKQRANPIAGHSIRPMGTALQYQAFQDQHHVRDDAAARTRARQSRQETTHRSAAAAVTVSARTHANDSLQPLGERKYHSLDRPILARQREVVLDEDEHSGFDPVEPLIRIPVVMGPVPPAVAPRHHRHQHNHYNCQQAQMEAPQMRPVIQTQQSSFGVLVSDNRTHHLADQRQQKCELYAYQYHDIGEPPIECCENEPNECVAAVALLATPGRHSEKRAKFYLGQHSLDCGNLHRGATSDGVTPAGQLNLREEPSIEQKAEECFVGQAIAKQDEFWSSDDRPFSDDDFRRPTMNGHLQMATGSSGADETDDKSTNGNCDQYSLQTNTTILLAGECRQLSRKKRSMKKSLSPLSFDGARQRLGLKRKSESNQLSSISVNRSEEVIPTEVSHLSRQTTFNSLYDSGIESGPLWHGPSQFPPDPRSHFVEGIGFGQIASRQALVSPHLGDIQLSLSCRRGMLEVEVVRARGLHAKAGAKSLPAPYVKVYLMKEKKCIAKCRTHQVKQTLDPLFQEPFVFRNEFKSCVLQVIVWGDYGKRDRKSMMGIVQIRLDELDISNMVIGWYKLFNIPSMTNSLASSKSLRQKLLHSASIAESPINCS